MQFSKHESDDTSIIHHDRRCALLGVLGRRGTHGVGSIPEFRFNPPPVRGASGSLCDLYFEPKWCSSCIYFLVVCQRARALLQRPSCCPPHHCFLMPPLHLALPCAPSPPTLLPATRLLLLMPCCWCVGIACSSLVFRSGRCC